MNADLSPRAIVLILVIFGSLLVGWFGFDQHASTFTGPVHMHLDAGGQLYIQAGNRLFQYAADGALLKQHDLSRLGIDHWRGDFAVFPNGDVLLSRQSHAPTVLERLAIFLRIGDRGETHSEGQRAGLARCEPENARCSPFSAPPLNLRRAFYLHIDPANQAVYLSQPGRHAVARYDFAGELKATVDRGLEFPNQIRVHKDRLYIANTNRHEIRIVSNRDSSFGRKLGVIDVEGVNRHAEAEKWPATFHFVAGTVWVISNRNDMGRGRLYRFGPDGRFIDRLAPEAFAAPFSIVPFDGKVLISDPEAFTVHVMDRDGRVEGAFERGPLKQYLDRRQEANTRFGRMADFFSVLFWGAVVAGLFVGGRQILATVELESAERAGDTPVDPGDPSIVWIGPDKRVLRQVRWTKVLLIAAAVMLGPLAYVAGGAGLAWLLAFVGAGVLMIMYPFAKLARARIGVKDDLVILKRGERYSAGRDRQIAYSDTHIAIGGLVMPLGTHRMRLFETRQLMEHIYPRLKDANALTNIQMQMLLLRHKDELLIYPAAGVVLMLAGMLIGEWGVLP